MFLNERGNTRVSVRILILDHIDQYLTDGFEVLWGCCSYQDLFLVLELSKAEGWNN